MLTDDEIKNLANAFKLYGDEPEILCTYNGPQFLEKPWIRIGDSAILFWEDSDYAEVENGDKTEEEYEAIVDKHYAVYVSVDDDSFIFDGTEDECSDFVSKLYDVLMERWDKQKWAAECFKFVMTNKMTDENEQQVRKTFDELASANEIEVEIVKEVGKELHNLIVERQLENLE